jgi:hypothetical protein
MRFQFQTTIWQFAEDSIWAAWIYQTDAKRKINCGFTILLALLCAGLTVFLRVVWEDDSRMMGGFTLMMILTALVTTWRNMNWMTWKKQFLRVEQMPMGQEDGSLTVELTDQGCTLHLPGETIERFRWERVEAVRSWSEGWDILDKPGFSGISLRRRDLTGGEEKAFESFLRQKVQKPIKPRAIELDELKCRYDTHR